MVLLVETGEIEKAWALDPLLSPGENEYLHIFPRCLERLAVAGGMGKNAHFAFSLPLRLVPYF